MAGFKDHFSAHAQDYRACRPGYPPALFAWLSTLVQRHGAALDLGCGNGQASAGLAAYFATVLALDPSAEQIAQAVPHPRVTYGVAPAEATGLPAQCADLIIAAQAFHWFDHARFFPELRRLARPGGAFAAVGYGLCRVDAGVDRVIDHLYHVVLRKDWPPERVHVEQGYRSLPFPLTEIAAPALQIDTRWTLAHLTGYLATWSGVKAHKRRTKKDPLAAIADDLRRAWGKPEEARGVAWPLAIRAGRVG